MNQDELTKYFREYGEKWLQGYQVKDWSFGGRKFEFFDKQIQFLNSKTRLELMSGGFGSGKTLALLAKVLLLSWFFPKNEILLGRRFLQDLERTTLPTLFELMPPKWFRHRVKEGIIEFFNGSKIIFFGLDALQSGSQQDIKKAQQAIKSLNLGAFAIDQLEEVEFDVFDALCARLRRTEVPIRLGLATSNPANYWAYSFFKLNPTKRDDILLIESSMLDNRENLPEDYIKDQLAHDKDYVDRYVHGKWDISLLLKSTVFASEYIQKLEAMIRPSVVREEGFEIWEQPQAGTQYQIGVDPSEGSIDPSSISVISNQGVKVAKFNDFISIPGLIEKVRFIYQKYSSLSNRPRIVPEVNAAGQALLLGISDLNVYKRTVFDTDSWGRKETQKLGWKMSYQTKQALISNFQDLLRKDLVRIYDKDTIEQLKTFCWNDSAKQSGAGASRGFHDDDVISTLLGYWELKFPFPIPRTTLQERWENKKTFDEYGTFIRTTKPKRTLNEYF